MTDPIHVPEATEQPRPRRKGIYILPNLFTLAALFSGFYAIVMSMAGHFEQSVYGIFAAAVLDSLDGRVARMTNTQSTFGEQMDSLSDMVSFGAAPALIMYSWTLHELGRWGWFAAFVYLAGAALRLARFNTNIAVVDKRYFQGVPSPAAAALVISLMWACEDQRVAHDVVLNWTAFAFTLYAGLTMVVNAPFYSFKDFSIKRSVPFVTLVIIMVGIGVIALDPARVLFALFCVYGLSGYAVYAYKKAKGRQVSMIATSTDEPDEEGLHR